MNTPLKSTALAAAAAALLGTVGLAQAADYATVISATPVTGQVNVPRQQCADVQSARQPSGGGALIGALVGGVLGNTIGHGAGRFAATGVGAVAGAAVGNQVETNGNGGYGQTVRDCRTVGAAESRVIGYDVVYEYHGQRYTTRTASDPGQRLAIDVRPAAAPLDNVGPRGGYQTAPAYGQPVPAPGYDYGYDAGPAPVYGQPAPRLCALLPSGPGLLLAGPGVLRPAGDRHRLLDRLAPRLPPLVRSGATLAPRRVPVQRAPQGALSVSAVEPTDQRSAFATTRAISSVLFE